MLDYYIATWRNWLAQEAYTFKVTGSSPVVATKKRMHIESQVLVLVASVPQHGAKPETRR